MSWKAIDRYSKDYIELQTKDKVKFYKTPDSVLKRQLDIWDQVVAKKSAENPQFAKIYASMKEFANRAVRWQNDTMVDFKPAFRQAFAKPAAKPAAAKK
jgi:TRAP-type mannitol/chloroaromatic compound transport system substrate-binding protein